MRKSLSFPIVLFSLGVFALNGAAARAQIVDLHKSKLTVENIREALVGADDEAEADDLGIPRFSGSVTSMSLHVPGQSSGSAPAGCRKSGRGLNTQAILFDLNSSTVSASAREGLNHLAQALNDPALAGCSFTVQGFTDAHGAVDHNLALSNERAREVINVLAGFGFPAGRLHGVGFGSQRLADSQNPYSKANRRVVIVVE